MVWFLHNTYTNKTPNSLMTKDREYMKYLTMVFLFKETFNENNVIKKSFLIKNTMKASLH